MKRPWYFLASLVVLFSVALSACATTAPAPTAAPATGQTTKPVEAPPAANASAPTSAPAAAQKVETKAGTTETRPTPTGTLRVAVSDFLNESMDPNYFGATWGPSLYDYLVTFDAQGNVVPDLAESYSLSPDGKTWTFKIRKGVKFHNGDPLTSADVAFTIKRFMGTDSTNAWSPYLRNNFDSMDTPDDYTFVYKAQKPESPLAVPFTACNILPKNYFEKNGVDYFRAHPIGTGAWKFVKWVSKTSMEMDANTDYWRTVPPFAKVIEYMVPEEATRIAMLKRGDVDIINQLSFDRIVELKNSSYGLQEIGLPTLANISFPGTWVTDGPTSDVRVRQAMSYAVNRQEICDTFFKGLCKPGGRWFMNENTWGWDPSWKADSYDVNKAKQLLADAGFPDKFKTKEITLYTPQTGYTADLMQVLQGYWEKVGLKINIKVVDYQTYSGLILKRNTEPDAPNVGSVWPWVAGSTFNNVYHSANMFTSKGVHSTGNDPQADALYAKAVAEMDPEKGKQDWRDLINYGYDKMWVNVGLVQVPSYVVYDPKTVGGFTDKAHLNLQDAYVGVQHKK